MSLHFRLGLFSPSQLGYFYPFLEVFISIVYLTTFNYVQNPVDKVEVALEMETDTSEIINELIYSVRKGGRIGIVGDYIGYSK